MFEILFIILCQPETNTIDIEPEVVVEGKWGDKVGEFGIITEGSPPQGPESFCVDMEGNIYILDVMNYRMQVFNKECEIQNVIKYNKVYEIPDDLCVDEKGNLYLLTEKHQIIIFSNKGDIIDSLQIDPKIIPSYRPNVSIIGHMDLSYDTIYINFSSPAEIVLYNKRVIETRDNKLRNFNGILYMTVSESYDTNRQKESEISCLGFTPVTSKYKERMQVNGFYYTGHLPPPGFVSYLQFLDYDDHGNVVYEGFYKNRQGDKSGIYYYVIGNLETGAVKEYSFTMRPAMHCARGMYSKCGLDGNLYFMHSDKEKFYIMKIPNAFDWDN